MTAKRNSRSAVQLWQSLAAKCASIALSVLLAASCLFAAGCSFDFSVLDNTSSQSSEAQSSSSSTSQTDVEYTFKSESKLEEHYEKHGKDMGFATAEEYEAAASSVVNNPNSLHKLEAEDGDDVYYLEETNDFVIVSKKGYIRTYFRPDDGKSYYDRQ